MRFVSALDVFVGPGAFVEVPVREGVVLRLAWAASARTGGIDVLRAIDERLGDQR